MLNMSAEQFFKYNDELVSVFMHRGALFDRSPSYPRTAANEQERPAEQVIIGHTKHTYLIIVSCFRASNMK